VEAAKFGYLRATALDGYPKKIFFTYQQTAKSWLCAAKTERMLGKNVEAR
jgi:hypothetical protein